MIYALLILKIEHVILYDKPLYHYCENTNIATQDKYKLKSMIQDEDNVIKIISKQLKNKYTNQHIYFLQILRFNLLYWKTLRELKLNNLTKKQQCYFSYKIKKYKYIILLILFTFIKKYFYIKISKIEKTA